MLTVGNYHYIRKDFKTRYPSIFGLTPSDFTNQLAAISRLGTYIHPNDLLENREEILHAEENFVLITFDDGLREQFELAKPILDALHIPALFFVNTLNFREKEVSLVHKIHLLRSQIASGTLLELLSQMDFLSDVTLTVSEKQKAELHYNYDTPQDAHLKYILNFKLSYKAQSEAVNALFPKYFNSEELVSMLYMNESQLKILATEGLLGSHSHSHRPLGIASEATIQKELSESKNYLEILTNELIHYVSYPYGSKEACASPVAEIAADTGYRVGFTMERGINTGTENTLLLKRFDCNDLPLGKNEKVYRDASSAVYK